MHRLLPYLMALATVTLWGASFPLTKAALRFAEPTSIAFLRWTISAVALAVWLAWRRRQGNPHPGLRQAAMLLRHEWRSVTWIALTGVTLFYFLENTALRFTTATNAGVLSNLTSVFMVLIGVVMLGERLNFIEWVAMAACLVGAVLVSLGSGNLTVSGPGTIGDALMIVACFFAAVYSIGGKRLTQRYPADAVTTVVASVGALLLLPLAWLEGLSLKLPLEAWGILLLLGLGAGSLANVWWLALLARVDASRAALALFLIPVISAALSVAFLGEPFSVTIVLGAALVLTGVVFVQRRT